ncbi:MAG: AbfB domain-containing protein [bacterium]
MEQRYIKLVLIVLLIAMFVGCGTKDTETEAKPSETQVEGEIVSLQSYNYPDHCIRHRDFLGEITIITSDFDKKDATFKIVPGLADSKLISFESVNYPGYYLRYENFRINLHKYSDDQLYKKDATFKKVPGLADESWSSFESYNYPGYYVRHRDYHLYIEEGSDDLFKKDVTFKIAAPKWSEQ